ncbi:SsrA-binding protein, partial [Pseudomonas syringae]
GRQRGLSWVARSGYLKEHTVKCEMALGKGKKEYGKRRTERERDSDRGRQRAVRSKGKED